MIRETLHFLAHAPKALAMKHKLSHTEFYDALMLRAEEAGLATWRKSLVVDVHGEALEIGCGTGMMFNHYNNSTRLSAIELDADFLELAKNRAKESQVQVSLSIADGQALPFSDKAFDYVIIALVLCSVSSVECVLNEVKRVLKNGGELRLIEHVRSPHRVKGRIMDLLNPLWLKLNQQGCNLNRQTEAVLQQNGFAIKEVRPFKIFVPGLPTFPKRWIRAHPA